MEYYLAKNLQSHPCLINYLIVVTDYFIAIIFEVMVSLHTNLKYPFNFVMVLIIINYFYQEYLLLKDHQVNHHPYSILSFNFMFLVDYPFLNQVNHQEDHHYYHQFGYCYFVLKHHLHHRHQEDQRHLLLISFSSLSF
jgi:hypothetical protein